MHPELVIPGASSSDARPLVLLTGAAGTVGTGFREEYVAHYRDLYRLRLADRDPSFSDDRFDDILAFDIADFQATRAALRGAEAVIHLAANPNPLASFHELFGPNVVGAYNLLEASRQAGCRRVIFASSVHVIMGYPADYQVHDSDPPRPDCLYGATKLFGEALCAVFARQSGLSCIAIRIGAYARERQLERMAGAAAEAMSMAVSQRDLGQLIHKCLIAPAGLKYAVLHGVSNNRYKRMDIERTRDLVNYRPIDDAFDTPSLQ